MRKLQALVWLALFLGPGVASAQTRYGFTPLLTDTISASASFVNCPTGQDNGHYEFELVVDAAIESTLHAAQSASIELTTQHEFIIVLSGQASYEVTITAGAQRSVGGAGAVFEQRTEAHASTGSGTGGYIQTSHVIPVPAVITCCLVVGDKLRVKLAGLGAAEVPQLANGTCPNADNGTVHWNAVTAPTAPQLVTEP